MQFKKPSRKIELGRVLRYVIAAVFMLGVGLLAATGLFIASTLEHIATPGGGAGDAGSKTERVDEALLERLLQKVETRTSEERAIPRPINNPFASETPTPEPEPPQQ